MTPGRARRWLGVAGVVALAAAAAVVWSRRGPAFVLEADRDRNVLLVTIDTLRADALGSYGGQAATPHLDSLARQGARFAFAHAHAVVTLPSHATILTGLLPYEHGIRDNSGYRLKDGTESLATRLKAEGFATGAFVAGFPLTKRYGLSPGFDVYDDQFPEIGGATSYSMPERPGDVVVSRTVDWIGGLTGRFFAWVHLFDPHSPYKAPAEDLRAQYADRPYLGEVAFVDRALGPLVDRLRTLTRPTLVVVTSDHGESLGEHGELTHGMFAYEPTLRVPLIVAVVSPRGVAPPRGLTIDAPVRHADIAPTVLEAAGAAVPDALTGSALQPLIATVRGADRPAYFEAMSYNLSRGWAPLRGVLVGREKYIDLPIAERYDLRTDPGETRNTAGDAPDRVQVLANVLRGFNTAPPNRPGRETPRAVAALRALGYASGSAPERATYTEADDPKRLVDVDRDLHIAMEHFEHGRLAEAVALYTRAIARRPDTGDAYVQLAYAYYESGQPEQAIATLEQALRNGVPDREVPIRLGLYLAETRVNPARAIALLEALPDGDADTLNALGVAYAEAGRYGDATRAFTRLLSLDPTNGLALQNLASIALSQALSGSGRAARAQKLQEAEAFARRAIAADPAMAKAHTTLGATLFHSGRWEDAIDAWKRAAAIDDTEIDALYNLWQELARAGRRDEALAYGRQYLRAAPLYFREEIARVRKYVGG